MVERSCVKPLCTFRLVAISWPQSSQRVNEQNVSQARKQCDATVVFAVLPASHSFVERQDNSFLPVFQYRAVTGCQSVWTCEIPDHATTVSTGSTVKPSGRFPSSLDNEFGSSTDGTLTDARARFMRSLTVLFRICRPADPRQARP